MRAILSILFNVFLIVWTALVSILGSPLLLGPWKWAMNVQIFWAWGLGIMIKYMLGITYEVRGLENLPEGSFIVAAKHQSTWDTIMPHAFLKDPAWVLKKELHQIPFVGWFYMRQGSIPVDRKGGSKAMRYMLLRAKAAREQGRPIVIFPEGTRSIIGSAPDYQPGVAGLYRQLKLPVVPMALNSGVYWGRRQTVKKPGTIIVEFLKPLEAGLDRKDFMARLEEQVETNTTRLVAEAQTP
jgi:1-acyl-sn-glycerol-3-phosphate acyltransferase